MSAFNPEAWLKAFVDVGGWFAVDSDDRISLGWFVYGHTEEEQDEARRLFREVENMAEARSMIREHLVATQRIPA